MTVAEKDMVDSVFLCLDFYKRSLNTNSLRASFSLLVPITKK